MEERGLFENTMIVFTSDHGDYLGDHWLGEKYMFHDVSVKVPMIIYDPSREADATRGTTSEALVEMIDLAPTFLDHFGGKPKSHVLEGRSLTPLLHGPKPENWRRYAVSEYDYGADLARLKLDLPLSDCRLFMITDGRYKLIHGEGVPPMLFDRENDPHELSDLGQKPEFADVVATLREALFHWLVTPKNRITVEDRWLTGDDDKLRHFDPAIVPGILIGYWDEAELASEHEARNKWLKSRDV